MTQWIRLVPDGIDHEKEPAKLIDCEDPECAGSVLPSKSPSIDAYAT
jgi:hypothetical protein